MIYKQYRIENELEYGRMEVNDHFPLHLPEIVQLLQAAHDAVRDYPHAYVRVCSSIQCRLTQGVHGLTSPHPLDTPIAKRMYRIDREYVEFVQALKPILNDSEACQELIDKTAWKLYALMND